MKVAFISLGCAKNLVNTEQMMALCRQAGHTLQEEPAGADAVVINTCGFIDSAKEEAIDTILSVAALKAEGQVGKILVTGCLTQRYQQEILDELPEVDGIMGTGSYGEIVPALAEMMGGGTPRRFADIHGMIDEFDRVLTTPKHYAYLRIAEGCDNRCAYCVIPSLRGRYRSRRMEDVLAEAKHLADAGVKECIVIAQDITRYGIDLYGEKKLAALLRELLGEGEYWVRPPYGLMTEAEAAALSVPLVNWSVDTEDWRTKDCGKILDVIYRCTGDGDIVLLHDRYQNSVDAALTAIAHLQEQGYVFVTVAELLALEGVAAEPGVTYRRA